nr:MAG TPA: hypothetical protein [Caudoviricetes sp.]
MANIRPEQPRPNLSYPSHSFSFPVTSLATECISKS